MKLNRGWNKILNLLFLLFRCWWSVGNKFYCDPNHHRMMEYSLKLLQIAERIFLKERSLQYLLWSRAAHGVWRTHILLFLPCFCWKCSPALFFWELRALQAVLALSQAVVAPLQWGQCCPGPSAAAASRAFGVSPFLGTEMLCHPCRIQSCICSAQGGLILPLLPKLGLRPCTEVFCLCPVPNSWGGGCVLLTQCFLPEEPCFPHVVQDCACKPRNRWAAAPMLWAVSLH